jgi:carbonic anhydrase/acetyltransferase-like protein (isoleucine patch superfamily)
MNFPHLDKDPVFGERVYVAPTATVIGDVQTGNDVSIWYGVVARGDVNYISIGEGTNIQDGSKLHVTYETWPLIIGNKVSVAHGVILHGCNIGNGSLIGIGARVLDGAVIGERSIIAAGALVAEGARIPDGHLAMGIPAKVVRPVSEEEKGRIYSINERYIEIKNVYLKRDGMTFT